MVKISKKIGLVIAIFILGIIFSVLVGASLILVYSNPNILRGFTSNIAQNHQTGTKSTINAPQVEPKQPINAPTPQIPVDTQKQEEMRQLQAQAIQSENDLNNELNLLQNDTSGAIYALN